MHALQTDTHELAAAWIAGQRLSGDGSWLRMRGPLGEDRPPFRAATVAQVDDAVCSAKAAFPAWASTPFDERLAILRRYAALANEYKDALADILAAEVGKPRWECLEEAGAIAGKVELTVRAFAERAADASSQQAGFRGAVRHQAHGVFAIFVPYNLPLHLPNGHLVPALLAGNTVVLKASEYAPQSSMAMVSLLLDAGLPAEAVQLLPGDRGTGEALVAHPGIDGVAFTGSSQAGRAIHRALAGRTEVMLALEMGGNNPMVVQPPLDPDVLGRLVVLSSMLTTGQRCTSARRLIVPHGTDGDAVVAAVVEAAANVHIAAATADPAPFCGPLVDPGAADRVWAAWQQRVAAGAQVLLPMQRLPWSPAALSPGVLDVTALGPALPDEEVFGPLLHVLRVDSFEQALRVAAATRYGLSAALIGGDEAQFDTFRSRVRAGIVNRNRPTNGALSTQPFGGIGFSGNHRPAGWTSVDYCVWPMASTEADVAVLPALPPGMAR